MDNSKTVNRFPRGRVSTSNGFIDIDFGIDKHSSYSLQGLFDFYSELAEPRLTFGSLIWYFSSTTNLSLIQIKFKLYVYQLGKLCN
jgi:hypothetical protein